MPEYTFRCRKCNEVQAFTLKMNEKRPELCTLKGPYHIISGTSICGGELARMFDATRAIYRSGGFQTTDDRLDKDDDDIGDW